MEKIDRVCDLLEAEFGEPRCSRHNPPMDELVLTILSQNTTAANCGRAFDGLRAAFPTWDEVRTAPAERVAESIRMGGLAEIKGARIKAILQGIYEQLGRLELEWLDELPTEKVREYLIGFEGIGPKTAACVLLFSLGQPVLPVDTHVHRVSRRVGLIPGSASAEAAHDLLQQQVPPDRVYSFHLNAIRLGREVCRPRGPQCEICILNEECDFGRARPGTA